MDEQHQRQTIGQVHQRFNLFWAALVVSAMSHGIWLLNMSWMAESTVRQLPVLSSRLSSQPIRVRITKVDEESNDLDKDRKRILEIHQQQTEAPIDYTFLGQVDHTAAKEQKVKHQPIAEKAQDPGNPERKNTRLEPKTPPRPEVATMASAKEESAKPSQTQQKQAAAQASSTVVRTEGGTLKISSARQEGKDAKQQKDAAQSAPRNPYESFLSQSFNQMGNQVDTGYQDYIKDAMDEGERIDINTRHYRYIGYFTGLRKAIELVWTYPLDAARRGIEGSVGLEFSINKSGKATGIKVVRSSGYAVLDEAIVSAIRAASPFAPLPKGFNKSKLLVSGSFNYVLSGYSMAH